MNKHERLVFWVDLLSKTHLRTMASRVLVLDGAMTRTPEEIDLIDDKGGNLMAEALAFMLWYDRPSDHKCPEWVLEGKKKHRDAQKLKELSQ